MGQLKNKWFSVSGFPHPPTQRVEEFIDIPLLTRFSLVGKSLVKEPPS
jgi:hypothetical protein